MSDDVVEGYRNLVHLLACHEYFRDDDRRSASIEMAIADFKRWIGEEPTSGVLVEALVEALQVYDCMRHP